MGIDAQLKTFLAEVNSKPIDYSKLTPEDARQTMKRMLRHVAANESACLPCMQPPDAKFIKTEFKADQFCEGNRCNTCPTSHAGLSIHAKSVMCKTCLPRMIEKCPSDGILQRLPQIQHCLSWCTSTVVVGSQVCLEQNLHEVNIVHTFALLTC